MRALPLWALGVQTLLSRYVTEDLLRQEHQAVFNAKIKRGETEIAFEERLHSLSRRFRNAFTKSELVNCYKQGLPDATRSMLENNIPALCAEIRHYLHLVKSYAFNTGETSRTCQAPLPSTPTGITPHGRVQAAHNFPENLLSHLHPRSPSSSISASVTSPENPQRISIPVCFRRLICRRPSSPTSWRPWRAFPTSRRPGHNCPRRCVLKEKDLRERTVTSFKPPWMS